MKPSHRDHLKRLSSVSTIIVIVATVSAAGGLLSEHLVSLRNTSERQSIEQIDKITERLDQKLVELEAHNQALNRTLERLEKLPDDAQATALVAAFDERVNSIQGRLSVIEDVITIDA